MPRNILIFLENGSKEGLTEAEIRGIGKVDEALALKKVKPGGTVGT